MRFIFCDFPSLFQRFPIKYAPLNSIFLIINLITRILDRFYKNLIRAPCLYPLRLQ
ncbi:hypothetical protein GDO81_017683 [Engystomops pustulosus]|uniref:Uncharacterized protein n=1 Tax=Engystomops pustulosus TaxID=76066 RepID=A0AAV7A9L9_ENGPU|nr:hypothetical protein GDO81_017683 [Engystomops pustulosus]